jgi:DNA replication protein DnaC
MRLEEFNPCEKCENGYLYDKDKDIAVKCQCFIDYQNRQRLRLKLDKAGIPSSAIIDYTIRQYIKKYSWESVQKLRKLVNNFEERFFDKVIYMYGAPGTQKTTLSYWVGRELLKKGINVQYILMDELVKLLQKEGFHEEVDLSKYRNTDCLIIDRAFASDQITLYKSGYQIPFIDSFLRKRIDQIQKTTIFVSNIHPKEIAEHGFGEDIKDLVERKTYPMDTVIHFQDHYTLKDDFDKINLWED